ncbi:MAG: bifunctional phosphoglucose/phosphomannose isomerase [Anaerolineae bacterium]|nr:bifunctional phosphoglucose/phosphomannose isomerase [Anaerolineae bacterium]
MHLDDIQNYASVDSSGMLERIQSQPEHLEQAWSIARQVSLPDAYRGVKVVTICGMGGSSISGELLQALITDTCPVPVVVNRGYTLPAFMSGPACLLIALSHSGTTEETLSATEQAIIRGCRVIAITTGGALAEMVERAGGIVVRYVYNSPPRAAIGWLYGTLLGVAAQAGLTPDLSADMQEAVAVLRADRERIGETRPASSNRAKQVGGNLADGIPVIWGAGILEPVARRWKTQLNENAKVPAYFEALPELNHNAVVGIEHPERFVQTVMVVQLTSSYDHPRVQLRHRFTHELYLQQGLLNETIRAQGKSRLAQQFSLIQFGDYVSYYLAMVYGADPTPIGPIDTLKGKLSAAQ